MKKFLLTAVVVLGSLGYVFLSRSTTSSAAAPTFATVTTATQSSSEATPVQTTANTRVSNPVATPPVTVPTSQPTQGMYKDGTYTGSVADAYYGPIQVAAVISGGKLTDIQVLQYPNDRGTSIAINQQALPMLIQEAISAQSSNVNAISGASDTSPAFVESLHAALVQAQA